MWADFSFFGTAAAYEVVSSRGRGAEPYGQQHRRRSQPHRCLDGDVFARAANGVAPSAAGSPEVLPTLSAYPRRPLQISEGVPVRDGPAAQGVLPPLKQATTAAATASARGSGGQADVYDATRENGRNATLRRCSSHSRSTGCTHPEPGSPPPVSSREGISREERETNEDTERGEAGAASSSGKQWEGPHFGGQELLTVFSSRKQTETAAGSNEGEAAAAAPKYGVQERELSADSAASEEEAAVSRKDFQDVPGSAASARSRQAARGGGQKSSKKRFWRGGGGGKGGGRGEGGEAGGVVAMSPPQGERATRGGGRRVFYGERNFRTGAKKPFSSTVSGGSEEEEEEEMGAGFLAPAAAGGDDARQGLPVFLLPRRQLSSNTSNRRCSAVLYEKRETRLIVKPCIWIAPQFSVDKWIGGATDWAGTAQPAVLGGEAAVAAAAGESGALALPTLKDAGDSARTSHDDAHPRASGESSEGSSRGRLRDEEAKRSDTAAVTVYADSNLSAADATFSSATKRSPRLLRRASGALQGRSGRKRTSPLIFYAKRVLWVVWYFVIADIYMCSMSTASDLVYQLHPQPKLRDRFHDWILGGKPPPGLAQVVTDCLTVSLLIVTLVRHLLFVQLPLNFMILLRFFFLMATTYVLRGMAIFLTTIPSSVPDCKVRPVHSAKDFVENVFLAATFQLPQCTDMIISGHTLTTFLCVATWLFYNNCNKNEADMKRAPFYIFVRWLVRRHKQKCATVVQQQLPRHRSSASLHTTKTVADGRHHQRQQQGQLQAQYGMGKHNLPSQALSRRQSCVEGGGGFLWTQQGVLASEQKYKVAVFSPSAAGASHHQQRRRGSTMRDSDEGSSSNLSSGTDGDRDFQSNNVARDAVQAPKHAVGSGCDDDSKFQERHCHKHEESESEEVAVAAAGGGSSAGSRGASKCRAEPKHQHKFTVAAARALQRNEAILGVASVSAPLASPAEAAAQVDETSFSRWSSASIAGAACPVPFATGSGDDASPPSAAAVAEVCAAIAAAAPISVGEKSSRTHSQELEEFTAAGGDCSATASVEVQPTVTDNEERSGQEEEMTAPIGAKPSLAKKRYEAMDDSSLLLPNREHREKGRLVNEGIDAEFARSAFLFRGCAALGRERPSLPAESVSTSQGRQLGMAHDTAGAARRRASGLLSVFATVSCSSAQVIDSPTASNRLKVADDSSISSGQRTGGTATCSSSEEEDGMRALLAPHQSRRRYGEEKDTVQFGCCSVRPAFSSFFTAAHASAVPFDTPCAAEGPDADCVCPGSKAAGAGAKDAPAPEKKKGGSVKGGRRGRHATAEEGEEEELVRMGEASHTGVGGRGATAVLQPAGAGGGGSRCKGGVLGYCSSWVCGIGSRLLALLWWACSWNMLGTWCILQAAANIIVIDTSFCHYSVDIFFGVLISLGCFTFYHMVVCLLWAARRHDEGTGDLEEGCVVVRLCAPRCRRRNSFPYRSHNSSSDAVCAAHSFVHHAEDPLEELARLSSPRKRRLARGAAARGTRHGLRAGEGAATVRGRDGEQLQQNAEGQKLQGEKKRRRGTEAGTVGDFLTEARKNTHMSIPRRQPAPSAVETRSSVIAVSDVSEAPGNVCRSDGKVEVLLSQLERDVSINVMGTALHDIPQVSSVGTGALSAGRIDAEIAAAGEKEQSSLVRLGSASRGEKLKLLVDPQQQEREGLSAVQQDEHRGLPVVDCKRTQTTVTCMLGPPEKPLISPSRSARVPRLLWKKRAGAEVEQQQRQGVSASSLFHADILNDQSHAVAVDPSGLHVAGAVSAPAAAAARRRAAKNSRDPTSARGRRDKILQILERAISGESNTDVAADIAISILRFPLVRCAAFFVALVEGLELP